MRLLIVFVSLLLASSFLTGQDALEDLRIAPLSGRPQVEIYANAIELGGEAGVKDATELILRRGGIPVVAKCAHYEFPIENGKVVQKRANCGRLIVSVRTTSDTATAQSGGVCAYFIRAEYREYVSAVRPESKYITFASLWEEDELGTVGIQRVGSLTVPLKTIVEKFVQDYLKENPAQR